MKPHLILKEKKNLEFFLNSIQFGIVFTDSKGTIYSTNKAAGKILNHTEKELKGESFHSYLTEEKKKPFVLYFESIVQKQSNEDTIRFETSIVDGKKEIKTVEININSSISEQDDTYIIILNDISLRKELEIEVEEQSVIQEEIEEELEKAQELSQLKSRFVSMASHEFRTPLAGILSSVNLAARYLKAEIEEGNKLSHKGKIEKHFEKIRDSVGNLTEILNEFLSLGKLEEGKIKCHWEHIDLKKTIQNLVDDTQKLCKKHQRIIVNMPLQKQVYILDKNMIINILNNLLSNAIKYSSEGSEIFLEVKEVDQQLIIQVEDEGIGIPKEDQKKLFSRFHRAKNVINIQGTGLGLNIIRRYTSLMNGNVSFESELNKGTTFTVKIPLRDAI